MTLLAAMSLPQPDGSTAMGNAAFFASENQSDWVKYTIRTHPPNCVTKLIKLRTERRAYFCEGFGGQYDEKQMPMLKGINR